MIDPTSLFPLPLRVGGRDDPFYASENQVVHTRPDGQDCIVASFNTHFPESEHEAAFHVLARQAFAAMQELGCCAIPCWCSDDRYPPVYWRPQTNLGVAYPREVFAERDGNDRFDSAFEALSYIWEWHQRNGGTR